MKLTKGDKVLIIILLVFSIFFAFFTAKKSRGDGKNYISVQVNGVETKAIKFSDDIIDKTLVIETEFGKNVLKFGEDSVEIIEASCRDQICVNQGSINKVGQMIICLPNRLVVEIKAGSENQDIDNFAF